MRSKWKLPFIELNVLKQFDEILLFSQDKLDFKNNSKYLMIKEHQKKNIIYEFSKKLSKNYPIVVWSRRSCILPEFIGFSFSIYNGKSFKTFVVNKNMINDKFGEYFITKKIGLNIHLIKNKNKKKESKKKRR